MVVPGIEYMTTVLGFMWSPRFYRAFSLLGLATAMTDSVCGELKDKCQIGKRFSSFRNRGTFLDPDSKRLRLQDPSCPWT